LGQNLGGELCRLLPGPAIEWRRLGSAFSRVAMARSRHGGLDRYECPGRQPPVHRAEPAGLDLGRRHSEVPIGQMRVDELAAGDEVGQESGERARRLGVTDAALHVVNEARSRAGYVLCRPRSC
jgi:hypothetical protein